MLPAATPFWRRVLSMDGFVLHQQAFGKSAYIPESQPAQEVRDITPKSAFVAGSKRRDSDLRHQSTFASHRTICPH